MHILVGFDPLDVTCTNTDNTPVIPAILIALDQCVLIIDPIPESARMFFRHSLRPFIGAPLVDLQRTIAALVATPTRIRVRCWDQIVIMGKESQDGRCETREATRPSMTFVGVLNNHNNADPVPVCR
jgi:hypothetical protein